MRTVDKGALAWAALALGLAACDASPAPPVAATPDAFVAPQTTAWSPGQVGTSKAPAYGEGCRLAAADVFSSGPNGAADDRFTLSADAGGADVTLTVHDGAAVVLDATVTLERALVDKAYRRASGTAAVGPGAAPATVVDGTLCFPERLAAGVDTAGEFSLVVQTASGGYRSVSGGFVVPGQAVSTDPATAVAAPAISVDLR